MTALIFASFSCLLIGFLVAFFLKRNGYTSDQRIKIVSRLSLSSQQHVVLIRIYGQTLLIGVSPQSIQTLHLFQPAVLDLDTKQTLDEPKEVKQP